MTNNMIWFGKVFLVVVDSFYYNQNAIYTVQVFVENSNVGYKRKCNNTNQNNPILATHMAEQMVTLNAS